LERFEALIGEYQGKRTYDVLMCYSGGKDSTYSLALLRRRYNLHVLAVTFDNGFLPERTLRNIRNVVESLDADHLLVKPRFRVLQDVFRRSLTENLYAAKTLERASAICTSCISVVKFGSLRLALDRGIPMIAYGWSPGQAPLTSAIMKNNPAIVRLMQNAVREPLAHIAGPELSPYFLDERYFSEGYDFPYNVSPLAFGEYNEQTILKEIAQFGWEAPKETDSNSTNCLLNSFANRRHIERYGFHPYAFEIAGLIRTGAMTRAEGEKKLNEPENPEVVEYVRQRLELEEPVIGAV